MLVLDLELANALLLRGEWLAQARSSSGLLADLRLRGNRRYARLGRGAARSSVPAPLGSARWPLLGAVGAVVVLAIGVPAFSLVRWLVIGTSTEFPLDELGSALADLVAPPK